MAKTIKLCLFQQIVYEEHKIQIFTAKIYFQQYFTEKKIKKTVISLQLPKINHTIWEKFTGLRGIRGMCGKHQIARIGFAQSRNSRMSYLSFRRNYVSYKIWFICYRLKILIRMSFCERYSLICMGLPLEALNWKVVNWPLSNKAPLVAKPCKSVYIAHKMAADGVFSTPSDAILWAIFTYLHGFATRGTDMEICQLWLFLIYE